tara:strand:- start:897 stop:1352 length:456 start_codon:yes stop_codon:yes gene_type:complete
MIRDMVASDIPVMITLGAEMHKESRFANLDFDTSRLWSLGEVILASPDVYKAAVYEQNNEIIGFCVGYVAPHFFGNDLTSGDVAIYVLPEHRKGMVGVKLIKTYDEWCVRKGVKEPLLGVSAGITPERIGKLYKRLGYTETYTIYKKPWKW